MQQKVGGDSCFIIISQTKYLQNIQFFLMLVLYLINMDYFLIFQFGVLQTSPDEVHLDSLQIEVLKQQEERYSNTTKFHFTNLSFANNFKDAIAAIMGKIHEISFNFTNIQLACEDNDLFTKILPTEFKSRSLSMPLILTNFLDWRSICKQKYGFVNRTLQEIARFLNLIQLNDGPIILKMLIKKLREEKAIEDTDEKFYKKYENNNSQIQFAYFRCIGLPFQISKNQFVQKMVEPQRYNIKTYDYSFIFQHGKFSGKAVVKVPGEFSAMVLKKNRMYIGKRYVQINTINQEEFDSYKFREERQRQESRTKDRHHERRRKDSVSYSSSSEERSRSREKYEIFNLLNESAIKIRGLPYSLNTWDIEQIFKRFNFVRGSIKMGFMGDRKSGQAVILFPNRQEADRAMSLNGFVIQNRYLQLKIVNKEAFDRFI